MGFFGVLYIVTAVLYGVKTVVRDSIMIAPVRGWRACTGNACIFMLSTIFMPVFIVFEIFFSRK